MRQIELPASTSRLLGVLSLQNVLIATWVATMAVVTIAVIDILKT